MLHHCRFGKSSNIKLGFCDAAFFNFTGCFYAKNKLQKAINQNINEAGLYRAYCFTRVCNDCCVLVSVSATTPLDNPLSYYHQTIAAIENFSQKFIAQFLHVFIAALLELKHTRFVTDEMFRQGIVQHSSEKLKQTELNQSELAVLYWSAQGKSAEEIGMILQLTKNTVDTYRRVLWEKLGVTNITQAVYVATQQHLIV